MKLTDEKIKEIARRFTLGEQPWGIGSTLTDAVRFARAILKEAGMEEFEPVAWMADSEQRFLSQGASAFVSAHSQLERIDGIVLYKKTKAK